MYQLLSQRFEIIGTCSNRDFEAPRIFDTLLPRRLVETALRASRLSKATNRILSPYFWAERKLGAKSHYFSEDPALSL